MITFTQSDYRRELYLCSGWNISTDDDLPHQPECDELDSAQRKRYFRQTLCGAGGHQSAGRASQDSIRTPGGCCNQEGSSDMD